MSLPHVLFVTYGGGHVSMVVPVARELLVTGAARVTVLGLTTAALAVRRAGLPLLRFCDFLEPGDRQALAWGAELAGQLPSGDIEAEESRAYLGLSFADLVAGHGLERAQSLYAQYGRQCFLPVPTLGRILARVRPDLVVVTNSPRAERAAALAARQSGIPALCINSLFAIDEIAWIGQPGFCDRVCVLNEAVRQQLLAAGRQPDEVAVTGNPSFDALYAPAERDAGHRLRAGLPADVRQVAVWASQPEPALHPTAPGKRGDPQLPARILDELLGWVRASPDRFLLVRPHPNEMIADPREPRARICATADHGIAEVLHACDALVTMTSTVAVQAHAVGLPVLQVRGSIFDDSMPLRELGIAAECRSGAVAASLQSLLAAARTRPAVGPGAGATQRVAAQVLRCCERPSLK